MVVCNCIHLGETQRLPGCCRRLHSGLHHSTNTIQENKADKGLACVQHNYNRLYMHQSERAVAYVAIKEGHTLYVPWHVYCCGT